MESGVYYGWAGVDIDETGLRKGKEGGGGEGEGGGGGVWGMVMSIGWNPYYKNEVRSVVRMSCLRIPVCMFCCGQQGYREADGVLDMLICCGGFRKSTSCTPSIMISTARG